MTDFSKRLARMEAVATQDRRNQYRANRVAMARMFEEEGDPRTDAAFYALTPEQQTKFAWLYDAWKVAPRGFVNGVLPMELAPEPAPYVLFTRPPAKPDDWAQDWTGTDNG